MIPDTARETRRVLVVDDHVDSAEMLALLLQLDGHDVRTSHDGPAALALAASFAPDVAFLDLMLPSITGFELARRLRAVCPQIFLIALTGRGEPEVVEQCAAAGFAQHLLKPIADHGAVRTMLRTLSVH